VKPLDPRLLRHARTTRSMLVASAALGTAAGVAVVAQAWVIATAVSRVIQRGGGEALAPLVLALAAIVSARALLVWVQEVVSRRASASVKSSLRRQLVRAAATSGDDALARTRRSEVAALAIGGLDALDDYFGKYLPQLVLAVVVPVIVVAQLGIVDVTAAITVVLTLPLIPVFMALVGRTTEASNRSRWRALSRLSHHFLDVIEGMPTLRSFGRGSAQVQQVRLSTDRYRSTTMATLRIAFLSSLVLELLATLSVALVAVGVGLRLVDGGLDLRTGLFVIVLAPEAYLPLRQVGAHYHASAAGVAAADAALTILEAPSERPGGSVSMPVSDGPIVVSVDGVSVEHTGRERPAPDRATLTIHGGEVVGLAGPSGSGKSSLVSVLLGLRSPDRGSIRVAAGDGAPIELADVDPADWHRHVAWVDQHPFVCSGTVADNLRLGDPVADVVEMRRALDAAGLGLALDRTVGDGGDELSAGERRRLAMARALLRRADLVVLDEATAGLDAVSEASIVRAARAEADRGAAVLMVAHRPAALAGADRVVVLG
jgi:thiol reductant ABC exporter CydD subunit